MKLYVTGRIAVAALLVSAVAAPAAAQISVDRTELVFRALPGDPSVAVINLHNEGTERVQATIRLEDWDRSPDGTNNWRTYATTPGSCAPILSVFPLTVSLEPDGHQSIRVTRDTLVPVGRECWAGAIVETVQPRTVGGRNIAYVIRTATKIYVQPAAALAAKGEVTALRIGPAVGDSAKPGAQDVMLEFHNVGGKHLTTSGEVQFRRPDNSVATTEKLPKLYTLAGAMSSSHIPLPKLAPGRYIVLAVLDYGGDELAAGQIEFEVQ